MHQHQIAFLHSVALFSRLSEDTVKEIASSFRVVVYPRGRLLFLEDSKSSIFYILAAGRVQLVKSSAEGREQALFVLHSREFFDVIPLIDNNPHPYSAIAMTDVRLYVIGAVQMTALMRRYPLMATALLPYMSQLLRRLTSLAGDLALANVSTRLARLILFYAQEEGRTTSHGIQLSWGLSHWQIAQLVGTAREVVTRTLKHFENEGILHTRRGRVTITDLEKLQKKTKK